MRDILLKNEVMLSDSRLPKQLLYGELSQVKGTVRGQRKRFRNSLKVSLTDLGIKH